MFQRIIAMTLLCALLSTPALAQNYVVSVHGIVCELCSFGVAKKVRKLSFIDPSQYGKGVKVDIKNQLVFVAVRDDASVDKRSLFKAIEAGGYKPVKLWVISEAGEHIEVAE